MKPNVRLDHCVIHVSDWRKSNAFYRDVLGAETVRAGVGWSYRFGAQQLNVHGPGVDAEPVARAPVPPGGSDLCFVWPGGISDAEQHLRRCDVEVEMGPVERRGAKGAERACTSGIPMARSSNSSRTRTLEAGGDGEGGSMTDVEHISRKGTGVPVSWFPVPEESELPENLQGMPRGRAGSAGMWASIGKE